MLRVATGLRTCAVVQVDAERRGLRSHAERGNDHLQCAAADYRAGLGIGSALLGGFLLALPQKEPKGLAPTSGPPLRSGSVRSIVAPRVGVQGPSLDLYASRGHPGRSSLYTTIPLTLLKGRSALPEGSVYESLSRWRERAG